MKNRILSFVLALVMVLALVPVAAIGSSAEETKDITISAGHVTVAPGGTVLVPLYAELSTTLGYQGIYYFQVVLDLGDGATLTDGTVFPVTAGDPYGFFNPSNNNVGNSANSGANGLVATAGALTAKGGALIALVAVKVDASVAEGTVLSFAANELVDMQLRSYSTDDPATSVVTSVTTKDAGYDVSFAAGSITVATVSEGAADANADEVDYYAIPATNAAGEKVTSIARNKAQSGVYGTLVVPAAITDVASRGVSGMVTEALVLKNTDAFEGWSGLTNFIFNAQDEDYDPAIYYHKLANGSDTMYDALVAEDTGAELINILGGGATVKDGALTVYGTIRVQDLEYSDVTVEAVIGDRVFEADFSCVYTTLTHNGTAVVSTNAGAVELGAADGEGVYVFGLTITGVPAGTYDVVVNVYGTTAASNGSPVVVRNDSTTVKVTV